METRFREISPEEITDNVFTLLAQGAFLLTAGTPAAYNTMTANWGGLGHLWKRNVSYCFVKPERHTFSFIDNAGFYTFSFFEEKYSEVLDFCGKHSGKDVDKAEETGITPVEGPHGTVYFSEARLVIVSRKLYVHDLDRNNFIDRTIFNELYSPVTRLHRLFIGEVDTCLSR